MATLKFVRKVWESFRTTSGMEPRLLDGLRITAASSGRVDFELDIQKEHTNRLQILHGGTIACLADMGGSLAVASKGLYSTGVSTDLAVTYLSSGGKVGDVLKGQAFCDKMGKTMAFTSVHFLNSKNQLVARANHTKYIANAQKDPNNRVEELYADEQSKASSESAPQSS